MGLKIVKNSLLQKVAFKPLDVIIFLKIGVGNTLMGTMIDNGS